MTAHDKHLKACDQARKAYVNAFTRQALYKMKDKLPRKQWQEMMGQLMDKTPEWHAYQEAWLLAYAKQQVQEKARLSRRQKASLRGNRKGVDRRRSNLRLRGLEEKSEA
ncbi:hypothetical protein Cva_01618 [Caedimonas varicaedens]|uniref:Uncharacterized protein n=1 Tax=Caedimonas varicaedens TaxID=1629334 RepID=A0A0K8MFI0_9PROT|nr:hypothetical protein Cva_01618 [Caedimonas varicaedens]